MNASAACLRGSPLVRRAVLSISPTGTRTSFASCCQWFATEACSELPLYFRILPDAPNSFVRRAADTLCSDLTFRDNLTLALQLPFMQVSESMGNHDSKIVDAASVD